MSGINLIRSLCLIPILSIWTCCNNTSEPPIDINKVSLIAKDISVTEIYLGLSTTNLSDSNIIILKRNGISIETYSAINRDTIICDTGLSENNFYKYQAFVYSGNTIILRSNELIINTLKPTSHNFIWYTYILGGGDDSYLHDVYVVDQNTIWAVGWISVRDSNGLIDPIPYNAINLVNQNVQLLRIPTKIWNTSSYIYGELLSMYYYNPSNICVSTGGQIVWYDGNNWGGDQFLFDDPYDTTFGGAIKLFGFSNLDIWSVGNKGNIFHFIGSGWNKINSGTTSNIIDIYGFYNSRSEKQIYCAVSDIWENKERKIIRMNSGIIDTVEWQADRDMVLSLWTRTGFPLYVCGSLGLYGNHKGFWQKIDFSKDIYPLSVRGTALNNVFIVGQDRLIAHFNGIDWKTLTEVQEAVYTDVDVGHNIIAAIGHYNNKAILLVGIQ